MIKFKHDKYEVSKIDGTDITFASKMTAEELGYELLNNGEILETEDHYLIPRLNEDGHLIYIKLPKED